MTPTVLDFSEVQVDDLIFATVPYGVEFTFPAGFTLLDQGMAYTRCTLTPMELTGFPVGTTFAVARVIGVVQ